MDSRRTLVLTLILALIISALFRGSIFAQETTPEATTEATSEITMDDVNVLARELWCPLCSGVRLDASIVRASRRKGQEERTWRRRDR